MEKIKRYKMSGEEISFNEQCGQSFMNMYNLSNTENSGRIITEKRSQGLTMRWQLR